jgi:hypothetical protein
MRARGAPKRRPRVRLAIAIALAVLSVTVVAGAIPELSDRGPARMASPQGSTPGAAAPGLGCVRVTLAAGAVTRVQLNSTASCASASVPWGQTVSFAWISLGFGNASVAGWWGCPGPLGCLVVLATQSFYGGWGAAGSGHFNTSSTGVDFEQPLPIPIQFWAGAGDWGNQSLAPGQSVELFATVD